MKKIIFHTFLIVFIISNTDCFSQNFGYMGKKNSINAIMLFGPAIRDDNFKGLRTTGNFNYSRTYKANKSIAFEYHFLKDYNEKSTLYYIKQNSFGIAYKIFKSGWIAPVGTYIKYSFLFTRTYADKFIDFPDPDSRISAKVGYGMGRQRIIADRFVLHYGFDSYLNSTILLDLGDTIGIFDYDDMVIDSDAYDRIFIRDLFYLHIGIGYLF